MTTRKWVFLFIGLVALPLLAYQVSWVNYRLAWRLDAAQAYIKGVIDPIEALPASQIFSLPAFETAAPTATLAGPTPTPLPPSVFLPAPAWEKQDWNNCGPATLSLYLKYFGL